VLALYAALSAIDPSPVVTLNLAIALRYVQGPAAALDEVDRLRDRLERYHLFHATRGALLRDLGREAEASEAEKRALALTDNPAERALIEARLAGSG
jgi:RNA polymerase sigma-70 factor (ECF subfamily)